MNEFKIPQISTLAGSTFLNYIKILKNEKVVPKYYFKILVTTIVVIIATPFHWWEEFAFRRKLANLRFEKPPLFIIGHWRSGTTLLHNILCKDPASAFLTTYQSVFPNNLASKWLFGTFMRKNMPKKRPSDNVELNMNFPQEDEFALSNSYPNAYYNFFYFPSKYERFYEKSVHHKNLTEEEKSSWYQSYDKLLKKALLESKGNQLIVKNPVNTARIDKILKLYPDAKFLYIYRNPVTVFYSTQLFFQKLFPTLWLNPVDQDFIDKIIFDIYLRIMNDYQAQKSLIPAENLVELKFEEFEKNPLPQLERIYTGLLREDFDTVKPIFSKYFDSLTGYAKNKYTMSKACMELIEKEWGQFMKLYNYGIPEDVTVEHNVSI
jgi:omega-hydroxy-beta-dihydromenaquinone-9 sulfotransferase